MTPAIRVSFQGGGVYLAKMLPVAHAIRIAEADELVRLEGVAGASAGSICASLLASRCDFAALRNSMKSTLTKDAKRLAGGYYDGLSAPQFVLTLIKIVSGNDLIDRSRLSEFIKGLLEHSDEKFVDIADFHESGGVPNLFIARSKLVPNFLEISEQGDLVNLIVDSCSIPFALKNFKAIRKNHYVDGGLCENLPVNCFDPEDDIALFAVSVFEKKRQEIGNISLLGYLLNLFSMTVGYSVERSKSAVGHSFCLEEPADFGFHEVGKAVDWYLDDNNYSEVLERNLGKLRSFAEYYSLSHTGPVFMVGRNTMAKRNSDMKVLFGKLHPQKDWDIVSSTMIITAHSATRDTSKRRTDIIQLVGRVRALCNGPRVYKGHILLSGEQLHPTSWSAFNRTKGISVGFRAIHYQDPEDGGSDVDPCYLVFDDPESEISEGDELEVKAVLQSLPGADMRGLVDGGDFVIMRNHHKDEAVVSVVVKYPAALGALEPVQRGLGGIEFAKMSVEELEAYTGKFDVEFQLVGVKSLKAARRGDFMSVDFLKDQGHIPTKVSV